MPSRGCRSSASTSGASSSIERPIVPPAPAEFSISSQVVVRRSARAPARSAGTTRSSPASKPGAEVRADVEDDAVGLDRARPRRPSRASSSTRLLVDRRRPGARGCRGRARGRATPPIPASARRSLEALDRPRARASAEAPHARALREDLHRSRAPIASARSIAVSIPPRARVGAEAARR